MNLFKIRIDEHSLYLITKKYIVQRNNIQSEFRVQLYSK